MNTLTLSLDVHTIAGGLSLQTATIHSIPTGCGAIGLLLTLDDFDAHRSITTGNKVCYILILRTIRVKH